MVEQPAQNCANHVVMPKNFMIAAGMMMLGLILAAVGLFLVKQTAGTCLIGTGLVLQCAGGMFGLMLMRSYATKLQDRIIRTEMRIRLEKILPAERHECIGRLAPGQLIALRFASDAEMAGLVQKVLDDGIGDRSTIKSMVKDWQGDYHRV